MNSAMSEGFRLGSGVDPANLKLVLVLIAAAVVVTVFAAILIQLFRAYSEGSLQAGEFAWGAIKLVLLFGVIAFAVF